ncbi:E3 ubiquitin-protein ligase TRIM39-like [Echeneis naucrates]|uniref:E3 ubiquitin-protein ligase TRIM39-like n=1 Tax=Echeneis naucrates TaxID=173247 RepID=A0A665TH35_ECHNA|nr:E3 ubiquitin-protein ligase TRIM39-like [Echeneis naucrates]
MEKKTPDWMKMPSTAAQIPCVEMPAASSRRSEDQFWCSICLDVFTDPVTTPCGHNFCKTCINQYWDTSNRVQCPKCKKLFNHRPQLDINTFVSEMAAEFRREARQKTSSSRSEQQVSKPGEVSCDICAGSKVKALKSCLVCLTSYCETHLEPHLTKAGLKLHQLIPPVENLEDRMCKKHHKPLELFCKTDQTCVCMFCSVLDHKNHEFVPLEEEYEERKAELEKTEAEIQLMIQKRQLKIQEIQYSVQMSREDADREKAEGVQAFAALKERVDRGLNQFIREMEEKQKNTEKQAEDVTTELEQEISELMKRSTEVEQLSLSEDPLHLLQSVPSLTAAPPTKDWTELRVCPLSYAGCVERALSQLEETVAEHRERLQVETELKKVRPFAVDVTLDPDTAHPNLILSAEGKQVQCGDERRKLPEHPKRFFPSVIVLGKQSFSSGRFYFEVQVKDKTDWTLGVVRQSVSRKRSITPRPQNGYWAIRLRSGNKYKALAGPSVRLSLKSSPEKVGVFVDYDHGLVSFYDVGAAALIYSFTGCCFSEKLHPLLSPCFNYRGENAAPLIICPASLPQHC